MTGIVSCSLATTENGARVKYAQNGLRASLQVNNVSVSSFADWSVRILMIMTRRSLTKLGVYLLAIFRGRVQTYLKELVKMPKGNSKSIYEEFL